MDLLIVGTGYVGLVTGACFAEMGHRVICLDIDAKKIALLLEGEIPIFEPGLKELVERNTEAGRLHFTTDYAAAVAASSISFFAVPTPSQSDGSCDTSFLEGAVRTVARHLDHPMLFVNKSTTPVGTVHSMRGWVGEVLEERGVTIDYDCASNPEFLKEGAAIADFMKPDRVVLGVESESAEELLRNLYAGFTFNNSDRILVMDPSSAEMVKYASNAMLAARISFMNEVALLCEELGADIHKVRKGMGGDLRIGPLFLYAGAGYGGSCFPKDVRALLHMARTRGCCTPLLEGIETTNERQKQRMGEKLEAHFQDDGGLARRPVAIWGLSFKPDTDDIREAPALELIRFLQARGSEIRVYDPVAMERTKTFLADSSIHYCNDPYSAAAGADAVVLMTEWKQFRSIDLAKLGTLMRERNFFDGRNQYRSEEMQRHRFFYEGIGVPSSLELASKRAPCT